MKEKFEVLKFKLRSNGIHTDEVLTTICSALAYWTITILGTIAVLLINRKFKNE